MSSPRPISSLPPPLVRDPYYSAHSRRPPPRESVVGRIVGIAVRVGLVLAVVFLVGKCSLAVTDRPQFLGLATARGGAPLKDATRVVIVLHGYGGDRDDLGRLGPEVLALGAPEHTAFVYAEGPYRAGLGRAWWVTTNPEARVARSAEGAEHGGSGKEERADSERRVSALIDEIISSSGLPTDHVYLAGFSQGAALALDVALSRPGTLGGVVAFSPCRDSIPWAQLARGHSSVRAVITHGRADRVCPFEGSASLQLELVRAGHDMKLVDFEGPHRISTEGERALAQLLSGE
jgi:phospholipase/carboxylesterase